MDNHAVVKVIDFAKIIGARYRTDGDNSAEEFFEDVLIKIADAQLLNSKDGTILLDLDYTSGYPSSFISELSRLCKLRYGKVRRIKKRFQIKSDEDPGEIESFWNGFKKKY